jgi:hypothetical protein
MEIRYKHGAQVIQNSCFAVCLILQCYICNLMGRLEPASKLRTDAVRVLVVRRSVCHHVHRVRPTN